ncbi:hypothetical protein HFV04_018255 [Pseudomonas sp. BIGb0427]|uniref:hypothetical protein n=1 Tax=unclassified Pseudomonas TaxID=196821 RepID=UPI000889AB06|nr:MULTISPECIES: hypothetical protein [unclassified Pseudomonas]NLU60163.1 hypothetical protein [Pseudomonas sp. BIGb0427]QPG61458.1 hypothetical protein HFV04_018255 [Pseudomonas sp. BIGb0427]QVM94724.1 hypothetical protein JYG36_16525 [Pseudomonas sp. SORT22]UVL58411.1 hypothetical protein LOY22_10760 [Pseudomonas sp. B21-035]UVL63739.1 hypothetical protein LOY54_10905 [Pseudomonas sp. B21-032]
MTSNEREAPANETDKPAEDEDLANRPITPANHRTQAEAAEELSRKIAEIERKVADGN